MSSIDVREKFKKHELSGEVSCILYGKDGESGEERAEYKSTHLYGDYSDNVYVHEVAILNIIQKIFYFYSPRILLQVHITIFPTSPM